jgi:hypothetical protein
MTYSFKHRLYETLHLSIVFIAVAVVIMFGAVIIPLAMLVFFGSIFVLWAVLNSVYWIKRFIAIFRRYWREFF